MYAELGFTKLGITKGSNFRIICVIRHFTVTVPWSQIKAT